MLVANRNHSVRLPKNVRESGAAKTAHSDLAAARSTRSYAGARFQGGDTNNLTPEFKAFLASKRVGKKKAQHALKEVVQQTAKKAVEGTNEVSLRDLNRSVPGPKGSKYVKPKDVAPTREEVDFSRRELERAYKKKLEAMRPNTSEYTRSQKFEYENKRIRQKKKNRNAKERPEGRVVRVKKNVTGRAGGLKEPPMPETKAVVLPTREELMSRADEDVELLGLAGLSSVSRREVRETTPAAALNDEEQEKWGF